MGWCPGIRRGYCLHGWWRDYLKVVEAGRLRVRGLLTAAAQLQVRLSQQDSPALRLIATAIQSLLGSRELQDLARLAVRPLAEDGAHGGADVLGWLRAVG